MRRPGDELWFEDADPPAVAAPERLPWHALERRLEAEGERRFLFAPVFLGCGVVAYFALRHDPAPLAVAAAIFLAIVAVWHLRPGSVSRHLAGAALFFLIGILAAVLRTGSVDAPVIPENLPPLSVAGWVERIERDEAAGDRITLRIIGIEDLEPERTPRRATVRSRLEGAAYEVGTAVRLRAVLLPPPDAARPGGFDYSRQAFFAGIGATGYAISRPQPIEASEPGLGAEAAARIERLRDAIGERVRAAMSPVAGAVATALITGQRSHIPEETEEALRAAGLAHILAISGLHMMLVVGTIFATVRYGAALVPQVALTRPVKKWAAASALLGGTAYLVISGWSIATQRAYIMAAVLLIAVLADRPAITMRNVAIAALAILVLRPEAAVTAGFQMSFAATTALVAAYEGLRSRERRRVAWQGRTGGVGRTVGRYAGGLLLTSFVAGTATGPFAAYHFHRFATYGLIGNLLAMPVFGFLVMPMALLGTLMLPFGLEWPFYWLMGQGIEALLAVAHRVAALEGAIRMVPAFSAAALFLITVGALWLGLWRTDWRHLGIVALAAGVALAATARPPDLFVGRSGRTVSIIENGTVTVLGRGSDYEREQWLAAWGLPPDRDTARGRCDDLACFHEGGMLAISKIADPAAFADDCGRAALVVATPAPPVWCGRRSLVMAEGMLAATGTVAIHIEGTAAERWVLRLQTASGETGARAWNWRWRAHGPPTLPILWQEPQ